MYGHQKLDSPTTYLQQRRQRIQRNSARAEGSGGGGGLISNEKTNSFGILISVRVSTRAPLVDEQEGDGDVLGHGGWDDLLPEYAAARRARQAQVDRNREQLVAFVDALAAAAASAAVFPREEQNACAK
jgi:hypothetical protein